MEDHLYQKDSFLLLGRKTKQLITMKDEEWEVLERKALGTIRLCLASSVAFNISKEKIIEGVMNILSKLYEKPSTSNKVFLMKRLFNMKMSVGGFVANHLNEFNMVTGRLSYVKVNFNDEVRDLLILCSLPESWNNLVMFVSNFVPGLGTLKFDDVVDVILSEEMQRKSTSDTSSNALTMESMGIQREII